MPSRRGFVVAATLAAAPGTGCSEFDPSGGTDDAAGTDGPDATDDPGGADPTGTDATDTPTGTAADHRPAAQEPDPDLPIYVVNRHDEPHSLSLAVARESGDVVHESSHELDPGADRVAYNLQAADPDGVEQFDVTAEAGERRREISVRTSECYGNARVGFDSSGDLFATYDVC